MKVLGSLSVLDGKTEASPTAPKLRQLLALLAINDSRTVTVASLVSELWHETPPRSALTTLQTYVLQLRRAFACGLGVEPEEIARDLLRTRNGGYLLDISSAWFDLREYRAAETRGSELLAAGDDAGAVAVFKSALGLWRGAALLDVDHGAMLAAQVAQLEQSRLTTLELMMDAELRLGHHRQVLSELASLVVQWQFHEDLHALYMLALYRSGHRTRALEVFARLRTSLRAELGVEPAPKLRWLQHAMLTSEESLDELRHVLVGEPHRGLAG